MVMELSGGFFLSSSFYLPIMKSSLYLFCICGIIWLTCVLDRCVMALIRGVKCKYPCPICLVPGNKLSDRSAVFPLRSSKESEEVVDCTTAMTAQAREDILKEFGLRPIKVCLHVIVLLEVHSVLVLLFRMFSGNCIGAMFTRPLDSTLFIHLRASLCTIFGHVSSCASPIVKRVPI